MTTSELIKDSVLSLIRGETGSIGNATGCSSAFLPEGPLIGLIWLRR